MATIEPGATVKVTTSTGEVLIKRAVSDVVRGDRFPVVWVCREEEWQAARDEGRDPEAIPWPADDVVLAEAATT